MVRRITVGFGMFALAMAIAWAPAAEAKGKKRRGAGPEKVFGGSILTSNKRFPQSAKSVSAYIAALKKARTDKFYEDKAKKQWKIYYAAFFKRPIDDLEVKVKLYDITDGSRRMVSSFEVFLDQRGETALLAYVILEREYFGVNKKIYMTIEDHRGRVLAAGDFKIIGEAEKFDGKVDFTEDETKGDINY